MLTDYSAYSEMKLKGQMLKPEILMAVTCNVLK
jgi:hypothetical protein